MPPHDPETAWAEARDPVDRPTRRHAANPGYVAPRLKLINPVTFDGAAIPDRPWLVENWIPARQTTLISGMGGTGKSVLAMQLATASVLGLPWLNQSVARCKTIYVAAEDDEDELLRRQAAINEHMGVTFGDLDGLYWHSCIGQENSLMDWPEYGAPGKPTDLFDRLHREAQETGAQLLIFDSLHDYFAGNENARPAARQFIQLLTSLARDCDGTVIVLAHPSQSGINTGSGESGSTAWRNATRSHLYLTRPRDDDADGYQDQDVRTLQRKKANYASINDEIRLRWSDGVFVPIVEQSGTVTAIESRAIERAFLACLDAASAQGRYTTDTVTSPSRYAPKVFATMPEANGATKRQLERAMNALFANKTIRIGTVKDSYRKPQKAIIRDAATAAACGN